MSDSQIVKYDNDETRILSTKNNYKVSEPDNDSDSEEESDHENLPSVLEEPVDDNAIEYNRKHKKYKDINLNVPKDQPVLLEHKESPQEFDEMEDKIKIMEKGLSGFDFFNDTSKKSEKDNNIKLTLTDWEKKYSYIFNECTSDIIPVISSSNCPEFFNISKFSTLLKSLKKINKNTISTIIGDFYTGSGFTGTSFNGKNIIDLFNKCNIDFITFGSNDYINENDFFCRIEDFKNNILCSNLKTLKNNKIHKTTSYLLRDYGNFNILFIGVAGINDVDYINIKSVEDTISDIKIIKSRFKNKYNFIILLSGLNLEQNNNIVKNITDIDLIIGTDKNNTLYNLQNTKICASDPDFKSVSLNLINKKTKQIITHLIPLDSLIPDDSEIKLTVNYWKDLGYRELNIFNKINPNIKLLELNDKLEKDKLLQMLIFGIIEFSKKEKLEINAVCIDKNIIKNDLNNVITGYDIYKLIPVEDKIAILTLDLNIYEQISNNHNLTNKIILNNKITDKITIASTENSLVKYLSEYIETEFTAKIFIDIRLILYEILKNAKSDQN